MSAHHVKHALSCPAYGNGRLVECECDAPGAAKARERANRPSVNPPGAAIVMTPSELLDEVQRLGVEVESKRRGIAPGNYLTAPFGEDDPHVHCAECQDKEHHWRRYDPDYTGRVYTRGGDFECIHCPAECPALEGVAVEGSEVPDEQSIDPGFDLPSRVARRLIDLSDLIDGMTGYRISMSIEAVSPSEMVDPAAAVISVYQVCRGCREKIRSGISGTGTKLELLSAAGTAARKARLTHKCPPPETQYAMLSADELEVLQQDLDREGTKMVTFSQVIEQMAAAKRQLEHAAKKGASS